MVRMQIYLTQRQREELLELSRSSGRPQAELIREAIDRFLEERDESHRLRTIRDTAGLWRDRDDDFDPAAVRASWDRGR